MKRNLLLTILLFFSIFGFAREIHVDCNNPNKGDGSRSNPFKTISEAIEIMKKGDICYIHQGIYRETINIEKSGTPSQPIVFTSFGNDTVIISATKRVTGWKRYSGNIYKKSNIVLPLGPGNNLYYNHKKMQLARWPNDIDGNPYTFDAKYIDKTKGSYSNNFISNNEIPDIDWTGGIIHYLGAHSGCSWQRTITGYDKNTKKIYFDPLPERWPFSTHSPFRFENGHRGIFFLMDKLEALDAPMEWFYDDTDHILYFYPPEGKDPNNGLVEIAFFENVVNVRGDYIHFEKLNFFGGMISVQGSYNRISQCMVKHGCEKLITNIKGASLSEAAIQILEGQYNVIEKCVLEDGALNGIYLSKKAEDNLVQNCIIQNFNTVGIHVHLINSQGERNRFFKNSLSGSARDGVKITGANSEFAYNHVQKCLLSCADGGLFYVTGRSIPKNIKVHHNWFHNAFTADYAGIKATGIYLDNNSAGYIVHHNVVWDVEWGGLHLNWNALKNEIYNNTFWNVGDSLQSVIDSWVPIRNGVRTNVRDNIFCNNFSDIRPWWHSGDGKKYRIDEKEFLGPDADNVFSHNEQFSEPPFLSKGKKIFMPFKGSPIIDKGKVIEGISGKFYGQAPDLGAYEYGGEYWIPGVDWVPKGFAWLVFGDFKVDNQTFK